MGTLSAHIKECTLRIAILGTRGIPGNYGGFETFAEELSIRLTDRGHAVTVYCRRGNVPGNPASHRGVSLVYLPAVRHKALETLSHTYLSALHAAMRQFDIVYVCNSANAPICYIPLIRGQTTVLNVDGLEWRRAKWGPTAKRYYRWAAGLAARMPIEVVTDADVIRRYYRGVYSRDTTCIAYGTKLYSRGYGIERLAAMDLDPERYLLYVSRLEPENNALLVVEAYAKIATSVPLVVVGDAPYAHDYIARVKEAADRRVVFLGYRFGEDYHALQANALAYIQATEVGGTHPALVEALGHQNAVVVHDVPEHREVVRNAGLYFDYHDPIDLARRLSQLMADPSLISDLRERAARRVQQAYSWDAVTTEYEELFTELVARRGR